MLFPFHDQRTPDRSEAKGIEHVGGSEHDDHHENREVRQQVPRLLSTSTRYVEIDDEEDDLHGDPYRAFTYNQLIDLCREKDAKLKKHEYTIKAMKSDVLRNKMREKARLRGELRTKNLYKENIQ